MVHTGERGNQGFWDPAMEGNSQDVANESSDPHGCILCYRAPCSYALNFFKRMIKSYVRLLKEVLKDLPEYDAASLYMR